MTQEPGENPTPAVSTGAWRELITAWTDRPISVTIPIITMLPVGVLTLLFADRTSKAFTNLGGALIIRAMGVLMLLGALAVITGILRRDPFPEVVGYAFAAAGSLIYSLGVVFGLGLQGSVSGLGYLGIALGFTGRVVLLVRDLHTRVKRGTG